ncbi:hypothetical protein ABZT04_31055 [Streptomyces sp. NPDC005492]|uniref:hypothetical protein n=1 Tax=Streptomyces sp. NPDC005492 TaxID=3156883 RepID=UPI0033BEAD70
MSAASRRPEPQRPDRILAVTLDVIEERGLSLVFTALERFANDLFAARRVHGNLELREDPREWLVQMTVADSRDRRATRCFSRHIHSVCGHVIDVVQEGIGL